MQAWSGPCSGPTAVHVHTVSYARQRRAASGTGSSCNVAGAQHQPGASFPGSTPRLQETQGGTPEGPRGSCVAGDRPREESCRVENPAHRVFNLRWPQDQVSSGAFSCSTVPTFSSQTLVQYVSAALLRTERAAPHEWSGCRAAQPRHQGGLTGLEPPGWALHGCAGCGPGQALTLA